MRHAVPACIAAIAVVLVAVVGLAHASTPVCPSTPCLFLPLLRQGQMEPRPTTTTTPTATLIATAAPTSSSPSMATATPTATATVTLTASATLTATATEPATATPTATLSAPDCIVPNFIGFRSNVASSIWMAQGFTGTLYIIRPSVTYIISYQSLMAGSSVTCSASIAVGS
jgi:hypothetical protein